MGLKRVVDIGLGTVLAIVSLPIILVAITISGMALRAWPLSTQMRVGKNGHLFRIIKIRTLPADAPRYASKYDLDDVKIPAAAAWLRRLHLDELPQLLLVPIGRMSLVGPRPEMQLLNGKFDPVTAEHRTRVRPGCTGLWQVSPRSEGLIPEAPEFDEFYIAHQSLRLDLWILWRTFCLMALARQPHPLERVPTWVLGHRHPHQEVAPAVLDTGNY